VVAAIPGEDDRPQRMLTRERWAIALLAVGSACFLPEALNRFVFPKLAVITAGALLAFTVPPRGRLPPVAVGLLTASAAVLFAGALAGATPVAQLVGRAPRYEGVFVLPVYLAALVAGARLLGPNRARGSTAWLLRFLAIAALAVGIEAALEATGLRPLASNVSRPGSLLGNASDEGAWAVLVLGPLANVTLRVGGRLHLAGTLAAAFALVGSGSRGALLGAVVLAMVLAALAPGREARALLAAGLVLVAVAALALPATRSRVIGSSPLAGHTVSGREQLWSETVSLLGAHPFLGAGPSGYVDAIPAYHTARYELDVGTADPPDSPHDWILQAAVAGGLLLALLAVALASLTLVRGYRATRTQVSGGEQAAIVGVVGGLAGYAVALLFHLTSPGTTPLAALFAGALLAAPVAWPSGTASETAAPEPAATDDRDAVLAGPERPAFARALRSLRRPARLATIGVLGALVVVLAAAALAEVPLRSGIEAAASGRFAAADRDFDLARALRPWDADVAATAAHAYASLASDGIASAAGPGARWTADELRAYPRSIQALEDGAAIDFAAGHPQASAALLGRALRLEPANPDVRVDAGENALAERRYAAAIGYFADAAAVEPRNPAPWRGLAAAYRGAGRAVAAQRASERAAALAAPG
jgi:tetratricopeptide (TPR) repeat protein